MTPTIDRVQVNLPPTSTRTMTTTTDRGAILHQLRILLHRITTLLLQAILLPLRAILDTLLRQDTPATLLKGILLHLWVMGHHHPVGTHHMLTQGMVPHRTEPL